MRDRVVIVDILTKKFKSVFYKQYDNNNELSIAVYEGRTLADISNYAASVYFELPSGKVYEVEGRIVNNTIKVMLSSSILEEYGQVNVECELVNLDEIVTTFTFYLNVEKSISRVSALNPNTQHTHSNLDVLNQITQEMVDSIGLSGGLVDLSIYQTKRDTTLETDNKTISGAINELNEKVENSSVNIDLSDYALKSEIPTVPTKVSQLQNDKGYLTEIPSEYITETELNSKGYLTQHQDISGKANKSEIPTKTSQLTNDSNFLTSVPSEYVTETELNSKGYLTEHQDISGKLNAPTVSGKSNQMLLSDGQGGSYWADIPGMEGGTVIFRTVNEGEIFTLEEGGGTTPNVTYGKIVTSVNALEVLEGESCTFTVKLDSAPTQNQVVTINSDIATVVPSPSNVTFTTSNYNTPVTITLNTNADTDNTLTYCNITLNTNEGNKVLILQVKEPDNQEVPTGGMVTEGLVHRYDYTNLTSNTITDTVGNDNLTINSNYTLGESFGGALGYIQNNNSAITTLTSTTFKEPIDSYTVLMRVSPISVSASTTILNVGTGVVAGNVQLVDWGDAKLGMYCAGTSVTSSVKAFTYGENQIIIGIAVDSVTLTESIILNGSVVASEVASTTHTCQTVQPYGHQPPRNSYKYYECVVYNRVLSESELISMCEYMLNNK